MYLLSEPIARAMLLTVTDAIAADTPSLYVLVSAILKDRWEAGASVATEPPIVIVPSVLVVTE